MASRWGSFLQQAVAGVEARLDTILAEGDSASNSPRASASDPSSVENRSRPSTGEEFFFSLN